MRAASLVAALAVLAGCPPERRAAGPEVPGDPYPGREQSLRGVLVRELEVEVLEGYDLPSFDTVVPPTAVSSRVGGVHVGVGPDDVSYPDVGTPASVDRWPLLPADELGGRLDEVESKRLELHLARDLSAAWVVDEVSYRVPGCVARDGGYKTIVIPLRMTALFVRDGERWVPVLEHLSYPQRIATLVDEAGKPRGKRLRNGRDPRPEVDAPLAAVRRAVDPALPPAERARLFASGEDALALWPDPQQELRAGAVLGGASLATAFDAAAIEVERWRVGMSPDPTGGVGPGSVAWVAATLRVDARRARGDDVEVVPLRLRGTFVLERRAVDGGEQWQIVQSHVSAPLDDRELLETVLGPSAILGDAPPWRRPCEGSWLRPAPTPPARDPEADPAAGPGSPRSSGR